MKLEVIPVFVFAKRGEILSSPHNYAIKNDTFIANDIELNIHSNYSSKELSTPTFINDYYFAYDAVDGRNAVGSGTTLVSYYFECNGKSQSEYQLIFTLEKEDIKDIDS